jgi:hypothetical protein
MKSKTITKTNYYGFVPGERGIPASQRFPNLELLIACGSLTLARSQTFFKRLVDK